MIAFAANSVLCRLALGEQAIDAASFTAVRLLSGVIVLAGILKIRPHNQSDATRGSWVAALMLFIYATTFSFAYNSLETGTGALVLFGAVQITIILVSLSQGNRLHLSECLGVLIAFIGFIYLVRPSVTSPSFIGFILMTTSGIAWGIYTLKDKGSVNPLADTTFNFARTIPLVIVLAIASIGNVQLSTKGAVLAIMSGGITSGIGYTVWYIALRGLSNTEAAVVQLSVPVIAAIGGIVFVSETLTQRLMLSAVMILGGVLTVVLGRYYFVQTEVH